MKVSMDYCTDPNEFTKTAHNVTFDAESVHEAILLLRVIREQREIPLNCVGQITIDGYAQHNFPWED